MGMTCDFSFPGNPLASRGASVTTNGTQVTVSGNDWGHKSTYTFDATSTAYTSQDHWYGVSAGVNRHPGGRPVTSAQSSIGDTVADCGLQLRQAGHAEAGALMRRIANNLRHGVVETPRR